MLLGFGTGLALICAIGAQNAYLLRLGIEGRTKTVLVVVLICAASDAFLILGGVAGIGAIIDAAPLAVDVMRFTGVAFLITYGLFAARRAFKPGVMPGSGEPMGLSLKAAVLTTLALTFLNPHVYLDSVIFLGSVANHQGDVGRWWWAAGAVIASFTWFFALGFGSRLLRPLFARPGSWRVLDGVIAFIMIALGLGMAFGA